MAAISGAPYVPINGITTHHTNIEPAKMTNAYLRPTMYPSPRSAAPVLQLSTTLVFSMTV